MEKITINAHVATDAQSAWVAYTDPKAIVQWNFATPEWCCPKAEVNLKEGGRYIARMEARDGSMGFDFTATFTVVDIPKMLEMTLDDGRTSRIQFKPDGTGTQVTITFDPESQNPVEMQRAGWQAILDNYANFINNAS